MVIVMRDLNAKVGGDNKGMGETMAKHLLGSRNDNGERLCDFCSNGLSITNICFLHRATGHVIRMERNNDCMVAMPEHAEGKRKVRRPKIAWRKTVEREPRQEGWTDIRYDVLFIIR